MDTTLAAKLKRYRLDRLWTLSQMANVCGLNTRTIWSIEKGRRPSELTMEKIRRALPTLFDDRAQVA